MERVEGANNGAAKSSTNKFSWKKCEDHETVAQSPK